MLVKNMGPLERTEYALTYVGSNVELEVDPGTGEFRTLSGEVGAICRVWMSNSSDVLVLWRPEPLAIPLSRVRHIVLKESGSADVDPYGAILDDVKGLDEGGAR